MGPLFADRVGFNHQRRLRHPVLPQRPGEYRQRCLTIFHRLQLLPSRYVEAAELHLHHPLTFSIGNFGGEYSNVGAPTGGAANVVVSS